MISVYGTIGPNCSTAEILEQMFRQGMTGLRLNLSHTTLEKAKFQILSVQKAAERCGIKPELIIDMQGPELRIGTLEKPIFLDEDQLVTLGRGQIPLADFLIPYISAGSELLLDDGQIMLRAVDCQNQIITAKVCRGGLLNSRKSVAISGVTVDSPALTQQDLENIRIALDYGVTGVMQPFVRGAADLQAVKQALSEAGCESIRIFSKIENQTGLQHLDEIIDHSDEIVIARGDLGNAMNLWELPAVQKDIAHRCQKKGKPFMVVTQMLTSMEHKAVPTRAEVSDIFNAVLDGASSVMVTGETAVGDYPVQVISYLRKTADYAEQFK